MTFLVTIKAFFHPKWTFLIIINLSNAITSIYFQANFSLKCFCLTVFILDMSHSPILAVLCQRLPIRSHSSTTDLQTDLSVAYWPSTEPSIKRYTYVTAKQVHPGEDIGILPWPVDVVEFGADAYAHRKQMDFRQLYNQVPQTAWGSSIPSCSQLGDNMPVWESACRQGLRPSVTHSWAAQPEWGRSAAMVRRTLGQYVAVCPRLQLFSHTQPISTLSRIKCERYIFIKKVSVRLLKSSLLRTIFPLIFVYVLCICIRIIVLRLYNIRF